MCGHPFGTTAEATRSRNKRLLCQGDGPRTRNSPRANTKILQFQQRSTCTQEEQIAAGLKPLDEGFGIESEKFEGTLTTYEEYDSKVQKYAPEIRKYTGQYPTFPGRWMGLYENVADAINGKAELVVKPTQSRDGLRIIELSRESHEKGITIPWS